MPHYTTYGGSYFSSGRLAFEDRLDADFDANDFGLDTKGIVHPSFRPTNEGSISAVPIPSPVTGDSSDQLQRNTGSSYSPWDHDVINASDALINPDSMRTAGYAEAVGLDSSSLDSFAGDPLVMGGTTLQNYQVPAPDKSLGDCTCDDTLLDKSFGMSSSVMESTGSMDQSQPWLSGEAMDSLDLSQTVRPSVDLF